MFLRLIFGTGTVKDPVKLTIHYHVYKYAVHLYLLILHAEFGRETLQV